MLKKTKLKLAILGAGLLGEQMAQSAWQSKYQVVGFYDDFKKGINKKTGYQILGSSKEIEKDFQKKVFNRLMIGIGYREMLQRKRYFEKFHGKVPFAQIIHPSCLIDKSCQLGEGIFLMAGVILDAGVNLEDNVLCHIGCVIGHESVIKAHSFLAPAVKIAGLATIGESCFIGTGSTIVDQVKIGDNCVIGAGAVVTKNIPSHRLAVGVPAKVKRKLKG